MAEKKFYLESQHKIHRIGLRAQVVSYLISQGIERGNVLNDSESQKKVIVAISAKEEKEIEEMRTGLVSYLNKLKTDDPECYGQFPTDITASDLAELNNPHPVITLDLSRLANPLMLEQTSKGVGAMLSLPKSLQTAFSEALKPLHALPKSIDNLTSKIEKMK